MDQSLYYDLHELATHVCELWRMEQTTDTRDALRAEMERLERLCKEIRSYEEQESNG